MKKSSKKNPKIGHTQGTTVPQYRKLARTINFRMKNEGFNSVTFVKASGERIVQSINPQFLKDSHGRRRSTASMGKDLEAIRADMKCVRVIV